MNRRRYLTTSLAIFGVIAGCTEDDVAETRSSPTETEELGNITAEVNDISIDVRDEISWKAFLIIDVEFPANRVSPTISVINSASENTLYSERQEDDSAVEIEVPIDVVASGGEFEVSITHDEEELATGSAKFEGGNLQLESFELEYEDSFNNSYRISKSHLGLSNTGDVAIPFDDISTEVGATELETTYVIGDGVIAAGHENQYEATVVETMNGGEYDVEIAVRYDGKTLAKVTTTTNLD